MMNVKKISILVMSGCLTERYKEELQADMPEIDMCLPVWVTMRRSMS